MTKKKFLFIYLLICTLSYATDTNFDVWLSRTVIVSDKAKEDKAFVEACGGSSNTKLRESFMNSFRKAFPNAVSEINREKKEQTSAVMLNISRASRYKVQGTGTNVVLYSLPVTATINFMNLLTGELLYSEVFTDIGNVQTTSDDPQLEQKITSEYEQTYHDLIEKLAQKAAISFVPKRLDAKIVGKALGLFIIDKGLNDGFAEGDSLHGDNSLNIKIIHSSTQYAVAKEILGNAKEGVVVSKTSNQTLSDIKKPKVTLLDVQYDTEKLHVPTNMFYQFFVDKLSQKSSFTLLPINKSSYEAFTSLQDSANLGVSFAKRKAPDYFMRLWIDGPYSYDMPTNVDYAIDRNYQMTICGEILDTSSRVIASTCKQEKIIDKVSFGKAYSKEAQFEVLAKNAALSVAEEFANNLSFEPIAYQVNNASNGIIEIDDTKNILAEGQNIVIYRNAGDIGSIKNVEIPIMKAKIISKTGNIVRAREIKKMFNDAPTVSNADMIYDQKPKNSNENSKMFTACKIPYNAGGQEINGFDRASVFLIAKNLKYPFYDPEGFQESINSKVTEDIFEETPKIVTPKTGYCIAPVYKYVLITEKDSDQAGYLEEKFSTIIGVKEFFGEELKNKYGIGGDKTFFGPKHDKESYLKTNILEHSLESIEKTIKALEIK